MKKTVTSFKNFYEEGRKLTMLTAYDYSIATIIDSCNVDAILVGDSLGMVSLGYKDTLRVTMEDMIHHSKAVSRGVKKALIVSDLPFMSYQATTKDAVRNAGRLVQEGRAEAVKIEGGSNIIKQVKSIVKAHIPVMAHIGLTPQSVNIMGGYKVQGRIPEVANKLIDDAKRLEEAGVFSIVLECIPGQLAEKITNSVNVPTIGIGAGNKCDGQVLVYNDMLGMYKDYTPKHAKVFSNVGDIMKEGIKAYVKEVEESTFPSEEHTFKMATKNNK